MLAMPKTYFSRRTVAVLLREIKRKKIQI